ncbi:MAG TPA: hypothetical protein VN030_12830 [Cellvibrio sp.]|nr:hypothetical protein [Cellvibrio sp.]
MKHSLLLALLCSSLTLTACQKKAAEVAAESPAPARETAAAAQPAAEQEPTEEQRERAKKQAQMDYAVMEDTYINDTKAQWAIEAKASSTFGEEDGKAPADSRSVKNVSGKVDGNTWTNNSQDIGFDWVELSYEKPVFATEVRLVTPYGNAVEAINKIELQDTDGKWNTVWSGISEQKLDERGPRTWFVQKFEKTTYQVKAVKFTIANNLYKNYKEFDAAQLVGE